MPETIPDMDKLERELRDDHPYALKSLPPAPKPVDTITQMLEARGQVHGDFTDHAHIAQTLKAVMRETKNWPKLSVIQRESLEMNAHKIGRILAGDPNYPDHWDDIAGYAKLVSQRL